MNKFKVGDWVMFTPQFSKFGVNDLDTGIVRTVETDGSVVVKWDSDNMCSYPIVEGLKLIGNDNGILEAAKRYRQSYITEPDTVNQKPSTTNPKST